MKKTIAFAAVACALACVSVAHAEPTNTVSIGYAQSQLAAGELSVNPTGVAAASAGLESNSLRGVNLKYHWESGRGWGIIGSYTYASNGLQYNANLNNATINAVVPGSAPDTAGSSAVVISGEGKSQTLTVGPSIRFNEYVSVYALVGLGYSDLDLKADPLTEGATNTSFAYGLGFQLSPFKNWTVDASYIHTRYKYDFSPIPATISTQAGTWALGIGYRF